MIVCKFGGTSVADASAITRVIDIVTAKRSARPIVVVSALGGATNRLLEIAQQAVDGRLPDALASIQQLRERHLREAEGLLAGGPEASAMATAITTTFEELAHLAPTDPVTGAWTRAHLDHVIGAEIARSEWSREGRVPLHTLRADIDYGFAEAHTTYGVIGVKVWIFKGEVFGVEQKDSETASDKAAAG